MRGGVELSDVGGRVVAHARAREETGDLNAAHLVQYYVRELAEVDYAALILEKWTRVPLPGADGRERERVQRANALVAGALADLRAHQDWCVRRISDAAERLGTEARENLEEREKGDAGDREKYVQKDLMPK